MGRKRKESQEDIFLADIGGVELDGFDLSDFEIDNEATIETHYTKPKITRVKASHICYNNAKKLAKVLKVTEGMRADAFISGDFIFGDFIEAFLVEHKAQAQRMCISTLSLSQNNIDSLAALMKHGYILQLDLIISAYFYANERRALVPYIYEKLDIGNRFQLAVASVHTKTCHFETLGGKKICIHGSANLRSSANIELITIEENPELYCFFDETFTKLLEHYATIQKPIRNAEAWRIIERKSFK